MIVTGLLIAALGLLLKYSLPHPPTSIKPDSNMFINSSAAMIWPNPEG